MPAYLVRLGSKIVEWSTVVDAPIRIFDGEEDLREHVMGEYGAQGLRDLPPRLERLAAKGTSSRNHHGAEDVVAVNRAGAKETCMTFAQIVAYYGVEREGYDDPPVGRRRCNTAADGQCGPGDEQ